MPGHFSYPARRRMWRGGALALLLGLAALSPDTVRAHAVLVESQPKPDATVAGPAVHFELRYNSRIDPVRSRLTIAGPDGQETPVPIEKTGAEDRLVADAKLAPGAYRLRWQVLSRDGHITRGDIRFAVKGE